MAKIKIAINGFGRIGRLTFRNIIKNIDDLDVVAINDLADAAMLAHLLKYDSTFRAFSETVETQDGEIRVNGKRIKIFKEKDPANLPWKDLGVDIVLECTGAIADYEGAKKHLEAGARKVIISAPSKSPDQVPSFVIGVNDDNLDIAKYDIIDMGSCTTNCLAPVAKILNDNLKIVKGFMTTVHSYTNDQKILDLPHKDFRRARSAAINIIPTSTGAAKALCKVIPDLKGKLDGIALRVPTPVVSIVDLAVQVEKPTSKEEVNQIFREAAKLDNFQGIFRVEEKPLVSSDFINDSYSSILDPELTMVNNDFVKVLAWYDNEWAYSCRLGEFAAKAGRMLT